MGLLSTLRQSAVRSILGFKARRVTRRFEAMAADPRATQRRILDEMIARGRSTGFGNDHHFAEIRNVDDFRRRVPVAGYERHRPYVDRVRQGDVSALFDGEEILMFALTSGTSNDRKFVPITKRSLNLYRDGWYLWGTVLFQRYPHLLLQPRLGLAGNPQEFLEGNIPCGSISGLTTQLQSGFIRKTYVLPPESLKLDQSSAKYYLAWRVSLGRGVGTWISPNPSTHIEVARFGSRNATKLIRDIRDGAIDDEFDIPADCLAARAKCFEPNPALAARLERILETTGGLRPRDVWPQLEAICCWLGGTVRPYLQLFPEYFGDIITRDIGLIATEGRMTVPHVNDTSAGVLDISGIFFEFIPVDEIESDSPTVLEAHELEENGEYYILLTTPNGLYRYDIRDVVRCVGWQGRTPLLEFLHKGSSIANLTGEKLTEKQVVTAAEFAASECRVALTRYLVAPRWNDGCPYYTLVIERDGVAAPHLGRLGDCFDAELQRLNCEYESKRGSGRLSEVRVLEIEAGHWDRWQRQQLAQRGGSHEQFKQNYLITNLEAADQFLALKVPAASALS